jgi:hypothetical protein
LAIAYTALLAGTEIATGLTPAGTGTNSTSRPRLPRSSHLVSRLDLSRSFSMTPTVARWQPSAALNRRAFTSLSPRPRLGRRMIWSRATSRLRGGRPVLLNCMSSIDNPSRCTRSSAAVHLAYAARRFTTGRSSIDDLRRVPEFDPLDFGDIERLGPAGTLGLADSVVLVPANQFRAVLAVPMDLGREDPPAAVPEDDRATDPDRLADDHPADGARCRLYD